ncbi:MAG TPA: hypothetical protein VFC19_26470 [Candidatus Limnocylindrales bacterium]|nr:hypothetical protein [Candidatus Limnocylindrales bacterium]
MFGRNKSEGLAAAAWHELADGLSSTRDVAAGHAKDLGAKARRRAGLAWDVLAGRPVPTRKWPAFRAAVAGILIGWGVSELYRRRRPEIDKAVDKAVTTAKHELREAKTSIDGRIARAKATPGSPLEKARAAVTRSPNTRDATDISV